MYVLAFREKLSNDKLNYYMLICKCVVVVAVARVL